MTYNAQGQRMTYAASGAGTNLSETFQYRGGELAQVTTSGSQNTTDTYVYRRDGTPLELVRTQSGVTSKYWYEVDGRGDVIALTDATGNTVDRYSYDLWGKVVSATESVPQRLRYAGAWYDQELGWYWMSTRAYDPTLERHPQAGTRQPDPSQQEGIFTYAYSGDDPVDYSDASGMLGCPVNMIDGICPWVPAAKMAPVPSQPTTPTGGGSGGGPILTFPASAGEGTAGAIIAASGVIPGIGVPFSTAIGAGTAVAVPVEMANWIETQATGARPFTQTGRYSLTTTSTVNQSSQGIAAASATDARSADPGIRTEG
jgi:RHS repeat-associated protein